ncbi:GDP-mannose 4,6-dehydratase [Terasakiella pusilla]|uniref:GDP-mannose 4,6-dehydratase n=1 Tax=Terasakiella pusilla TaxID=64973 RepID=UPI003AA9B105
MPKFDKVMVLGSNSFSGASFCAYLLKQGVDVIGVSRSEEANSVYLPYKWTDTDQNFRFYQYDLNNDLDEIIALVKREKLSCIVNFAAQSMVGQSWEMPEHWFQTNAVSTTKLINALKKIDFLSRYVHVTTPEVYGSTDRFITEDEPFNPSTPYAVSRAAGDMSLKSYMDAYDFPALMTRAANVYGAGQPLYRIIPRMIYFIKTGQKLDLHGGGVSQRSFIHMEDVAKATWQIATEATVGQTYHISTNEIVTVRQLVEKICSRLKVSFEDYVNVGEERLGKDQAYLLSSEKLRQELGWTDQVTLDDGIDECIQWVERNLDVLKTMPQSYIHKP